MTAADDLRWMALALQQARQGLYTTSPNPRVGCVIVKQSRLLSQGFHRRAGEPHAERHALHGLSLQQTAGATVYVTLEPCSHVGRTGPCADALVAAGVARVVIAMIDPNPQVAGQGVARLRAAGIQVDVGVLKDAASALNPGFIQRFTQQRPWVRVKLAISLDGRTAMASGESFWITGAAAREDVQRLRARSCAVVTGIGTVLADNPALTVRPADWQLADYGAAKVRQPLRVLLDSQGQVTPKQRLFTETGEVLVVTASEAAQQRLQQQGLEALALGQGERVDLTLLMAELVQRQCNEVLVEAGARLTAAFLEAGLIDELVVYQAPVLLGQQAQPMMALDLSTMAEKRCLSLIDQRAVGADQRYTFAVPSMTQNRC